MTETRDNWEDDLLGRKDYADFLTAFLSSKVKADDVSKSRPFSLALDADWGFGKSFFIERWKCDLEQAQAPHPTMLFDAWAADYAADPIVSLMAAFRAALTGLLSLSTLQEKARETARRKIDAAVKGFRRAIIPAGREVVKGLLKKATGVAVDEVIDAWRNDTEIEIDDASLTKLERGAGEALNKGLDLFLAKALEEQSERGQLIEQLRASIRDTLDLLASEGVIQLPMFVFVDELDRCRPTFALALLEGIKHLFGVPGVCFVVATNFSQLRHAVKAVYGPDFDGHGYLKRFFDAEFTLPEAAGEGLVRSMLNDLGGLERNNVCLGLPEHGFAGRPQVLTAADSFDWIFTAFDLDYRSQRKVMEMTLAAATGLPNTKPLHLLWLAILCAVRHKNPTEFAAMRARAPGFSFDSMWSDIAPKDRQREITVVHDPFRSSPSRRQFSLKDVASLYYAHASSDLKQIHETFVSNHDFPYSLMRVLGSELPGSYMERDKHRPSTSNYFDLVLTAGHFK